MRLDNLNKPQLEKLWTQIANCVTSGRTELKPFYARIEQRINDVDRTPRPHGPPPGDEHDVLEERSKLLTAHARGIALALGQTGVAEPEPVVSAQGVPLSNKGLIGSANAPAAVAEALSLVSDIAVKRAKQHGLGFLKMRLELAVCGVTLPDDESTRIFPATCELVVRISPDKLVGDPRVVQVALFQDLLAVLVARMIDDNALTCEPALPECPAETNAQKSLKSLARLAIRIAARTLSRRDFGITVEDARTIVTAMIDTAGLDRRSRIQWGKARAIPYGLAAGSMWDEGKTGTLPEIVRALESTNTGAGTPPALSPDEFARALEIANLTVVAATAMRSESLPDGGERLSAAIDLVFECVLEYVRVEVCDETAKTCVARERTRQVHTIVHAAVDRDVQNAVSGAVRLLLDLDAEATRAVTAAEDALDAARRALESAGDAARETAERALRSAEDELAKLRKTLSASITRHRAYERRTEKAAALIAAIAAYADTYAPPKASDAAKTGAPTAEELRKKRQAVLEGLIDATTVRDRRHGEWVFSLGIPVGFSTGFQLVRERVRDDAGEPVLVQNQPRDRWSAPRPMYPQLELPMGFAAQKLVGHQYARGRERPCKDDKLRPCDARVRFDGVHLFVSMIDLGQFLAFDEKGKLSRPRWDSFVSPGAQVGWIFGRPQNSFVVGVEGRYAPTLFAGTSELTIPADTNPGGAARFGVFVAYYISLFDFN